MALIETWIVKNNHTIPLSINDITIPVSLSAGKSVDLISMGNTAEVIAGSIQLRGYNTKYLPSGLPWISSDYLHSHTEFAPVSHTHNGLTILTAGSTSDASALHTHNNLVTSSEMETQVHGSVEQAVTDLELDNTYVRKDGSINQLSDITSTGDKVEEAIAKAHNEEHTLLSHIDGDVPFTISNLRKLFDGSNADCLHTHSGVGETDGEHNDLNGLQGGGVDEYYHLSLSEYNLINSITASADEINQALDGIGNSVTSENLNSLTDGSNADSLHTHSGLVLDHNHMDGLQGGTSSDPSAEPEYYHLDYNQYISLIGGPSVFADEYHTHSFATSADAIPLGNAGDGDWTDGLFGWTNSTITATAIDDINEVLSSLAPSPAPNLDDIGVNNSNGVSEDLSFGSSQSISGYANCTGIGALSAVDINGTFTNSGKREGIINDGVDISGIIASDIPAGSGSPTNAYPVCSFGDADQGTLILELNGVEQTSKNIDLTNLSAQDTTVGDTITGLNVIAATAVKFPNGDSFNQFKYRTGSYRIKAGDMRNGWNYARVIHRIGITNRETNYVDWVVDSDNTSTSFSGESLHTYVPSATKYISGVIYDTAATALYNITINNAYRNTYVTSTTAITFNENSIDSVSNESLANISVGVDNESKQHIIANKSVVVDTTSCRLLNQSISLTTSVNRTVQTDATSSGGSISGLLFDNYSASETDLSETFNAEGYRQHYGLSLSSVAYSSGAGNGPSTWDSTKSLVGADSNYNNGLLVYNGTLRYPTQGVLGGDFRNTSDLGSILNGPSGNPNYSGANGNRTYLRYFYVGTGKQNFTISMTGTEPTAFVSVATGVSSNNLTLELLAPSTTTNGVSYEFKDCTVDYTNDNSIGCYVSGTKDIGTSNWVCTIGTKSTASSGNVIILRITASSAWTGNIASLTVAV